MLRIDTTYINKGIFNPISNTGGKYGIWDLTASSIWIDGTNFQFSGAHTIGNDEVMRPDLIAHRKFGDQGKCGTLMKLSGISNPFAIDVGDVLYIPKESSIEAAYNRRKEIQVTPPSSSDSNDKFRKKQQDKKFSVSKGRIEYLKNKTSGSLAPNLLEEEEKTIVTKSGLIFFGPDATSPNG